MVPAFVGSSGPGASLLGQLRAPASLTASPRRGGICGLRAKTGDAGTKSSRRDVVMAVALALAASTSLLASPSEASAELVKDKYGRCVLATRRFDR